jgi:hypothetical protein
MNEWKLMISIHTKELPKCSPVVQKTIMGYIRYPPITLEKTCKVFTNMWNLFSEFYNQRNPLYSSKLFLIFLIYLLLKIVATLMKQIPHSTGLASFLIGMGPTMPIP